MKDYGYTNKSVCLSH